MNRIPRAWIGSCVDWHGFDGQHYTAHVDAIRNGIAILTYFAQVGAFRKQVQAYVGANLWKERVNHPVDVPGTKPALAWGPRDPNSGLLASGERARTMMEAADKQATWSCE